MLMDNILELLENKTSLGFNRLIVPAKTVTSEKLFMIFNVLNSLKS